MEDVWNLEMAPRFKWLRRQGLSDVYVILVYPGESWEENGGVLKFRDRSAVAAQWMWQGGSSDPGLQDSEPKYIPFSTEKLRVISM